MEYSESIQSHKEVIKCKDYDEAVRVLIYNIVMIFEKPVSKYQSSNPTYVYLILKCSYFGVLLGDSY